MTLPSVTTFSCLCALVLDIHCTVRARMGGCFHNNCAHPCRYVAKTSMRQGTDVSRNVAEMEEDVNAHMIARQYAKDFNRALAGAGAASHKVTYHPVHIVLLEEDSPTPAPQAAMFLEPYLTGRYKFWDSMQALNVAHMSRLWVTSSVMCQIPFAAL